MAALALDASNPDVSVLRSINGLVREAPPWVNHAAQFTGLYGSLAALAVLWCVVWWRGRRLPDAPAAASGLVWAALAAGIAVLADIPIRSFVGRPRPFREYAGVHLLGQGPHDLSFVSDHAAAATALAAGLFMVNRRFGLVGVGLALLGGFCQVYMGVHYPTDVVGGFALGMASALLLAPPALAALVPLCRRVAGSRAAWLVRAGGAPQPDAGRGGPDGAGGGAGHGDDEARTVDAALEEFDGLEGRGGLDGLAGRGGSGGLAA